MILQNNKGETIVVTDQSVYAVIETLAKKRKFKEIQGLSEKHPQIEGYAVARGYIR